MYRISDESHVACLSLAENIMNIIIVAAASIPVAFVVVSAAATDGGMAQTITHLRLYSYFVTKLSL